MGRRPCGGGRRDWGDAATSEDISLVLSPLFLVLGERVELRGVFGATLSRVWSDWGCVSVSMVISWDP